MLLRNRALEFGATRVNLGTAALENPEWTKQAIARHGDKIAVGMDVRGTTLSGHGWTKDGGDLWDVLARLEDAGCARYVVTDVTKDGTLRGPNVEYVGGRSQLRRGKPIVASGGISSLEDLRVLRELVPEGIEGAIMGKALYSGQFTLQEALNIRWAPLGSTQSSEKAIQKLTLLNRLCLYAKQNRRALPPRQISSRVSSEWKSEVLAAGCPTS